MGKRSRPKNAPHPVRKEGATLRPREMRGWRGDLYWVLPALVAALLVYANTLHGEFVYDDQQQIIRNTLIQDGSQFWRALTSDVWWAFNGGEQAVSNYWRPSFVLWMIFNFRCFGLAPFGWHLTNIVLHLTVIAVAFAVLRHLGISRQIAGAIALLFAVHPIHSESVAWISGAPDLILGGALLGSLWFVVQLRKNQTPFRWVLSLGLFLVALGAKEIAMVYPLIVAAVVGDRDSDQKPGARWREIFTFTWPFVAVAAIYLLTRQVILGTTQRFPVGGANLTEAILTAPAVFTFYLRQALIPFWIGPSYPLRAVTPQTMGANNFFLPLFVTMIAGWWMIWMARRSKIAKVGVALFLIPLLPAMNIVVFGPEHIVHDRYLYLPLLGLLILLIPGVASLLQRIKSDGTVRQSLLIFLAAVLLSIPLGAQTIRYNRAWTSNLALWEWGVRSDPTSAYNYQQYGVQLQEAKRLDEAITAFNRSIEIAPLASTYVTRGTALIDQQKFAEAERDLREVVSRKSGEVASYTLYRAYRNLATALTRERKLIEAAEAVREARIRLPQYAAALTGKLAIALYEAGRKDEAVSEINGMRMGAHTETLPESRLLLYSLGLLNAELGRTEEARAAFLEFLSVTQGMLTPEIKQARLETETTLRKLGR